ncbi:MAG: ribonuclease E/G [Hyphomicrobiaceae bacterium]
MSQNKMLIDATHPEETRVVVLRDGRVEEFDYESAARKLLRGNIYLAKVTRVEPSLQAAFVDYGGNRHGFLAFNEIHPDYYQIPIADRQALLQEEAEEEARDEEEVEAHISGRRGGRDESRGSRHDAEAPAESDGSPQHRDDGYDTAPADIPGSGPQPTLEGPASISERTGLDEPRQASDVPAAAEYHETAPATEPDASADAEDVPEPRGLVEDTGLIEIESVDGPENGEAVPVEEVGSEDALEEVPERPRRRRARSYKIQEVIKRRQIILVQVVKEERGNKGAALTTYLSLAGRYTVLMPNTARGGGISRKITNPTDRRRLKKIAEELEVPEGMGLIIRTAGAARTKAEIKRDFEYLLRLWESVRDLTLQSTAPALVYEEGDLIKRSIRDLYTKEIDEIVVAGGNAHSEAREFMRMLMPSHAKNVVTYEAPEPLFTKFQIERQLNALFSPYVHLRSGGYLVINQTEALVSIDINSGKSTREFSIEETALNTNLEAADEIARQLKLRDLAGLIVIDFIDMEEKRNNRAVERRLKDALRFDRARIQVGHISHFGLLEMSRQRLRTGVLEGSTSQCPHCLGTGVIRSTESVALAVLRALEDLLMAGERAHLSATAATPVALYILNQKRAFINDMESRHGNSITIVGSDRLQGANFTIEKMAGGEAAEPAAQRTAVKMEWGFDEAETTPAAREGEGDPARRKSRRRRRRRDRDEETMVGDEGHNGSREHTREAHGRHHEHAESHDHDHDEPDEDAAEPRESQAGGEGGREPGRDGEERRGRRSRRRGRRGGRRNRADMPSTSQDAAGGPRAGERTPSDDTDHDTTSTASGPADTPEPALDHLERFGFYTAPIAAAPSRRQPRATVEGRPAAVEDKRAARAPEVKSTSETPHNGGWPASRAEDSSESGTKPSEAESKFGVLGDEPSLVTATVEPPGGGSMPSPALTAEPPVVATVAAEPAPSPAAEPSPEPSKPAKRGWWQRSS